MGKEGTVAGMLGLVGGKVWVADGVREWVALGLREWVVVDGALMGGSCDQELLPG